MFLIKDKAYNIYFDPKRRDRETRGQRERLIKPPDKWSQENI